MQNFETFVQLHQQHIPLLLGNIWNVQSAKMFEAAGYKAIGTSSMAVANAFGYDDGEQIPFDILLQLAKRVVETVKIPFTVDVEGGFSRTAEGIIGNIQKLHDAGVAGINIEDTIAGSTSTLQPVTAFEKTLTTVNDYLSRNNIKVYINVRTDGFLLGMPTALAETIHRIKRYEATGINGIFVPCITNSNHIKQVVQSTALPINVMCMPALPTFDELTALGVKRISMGAFFFEKVYKNAATLAQTVANGNLAALFA